MDLTPEQEIEAMPQPDWDTFFMGMVFYYAMKSPDRQTKQGCIIVDNRSHVPIGFGFNGHPRKCKGLPCHRAGTLLPDGTTQQRPDKYPFMVHADINAIVNLLHDSPDATMYLPMPPCEVCFGAALNLPFTQITRVVFYEDRDYSITYQIADQRPDVRLVPYRDVVPSSAPLGVEQTLLQAARYVHLRQEFGEGLSGSSAKTYRG